jgi:lipoprotein-releasing system permease protein
VNLPFYIARRYLFSKKSHNIINVISGISLSVVAVVTMAMIIVLSAFNGIEGLVKQLYSIFEPDITITPARGKTMTLSAIDSTDVCSFPGVAHCVPVIEENVMIDYAGKQRIATIKGVGEGFRAMTGMDSVIVDGEFILRDRELNFALVGYGLKYELGMSIYQNSMRPLKVFAPIRGKKISQSQEKAFNRKDMMIGGIFSISPDFDSRYFITAIDFATDLFGYENEITTIEIGLEPGLSAVRAQRDLSAMLGEDYTVKTRLQKNEIVFKTNQSEKWITFFILSFILLIASFNIIASLTMLIIDKKKDIFILNSMGATTAAVRRIFFYEGVLINVIGAGLGLLLGYLFCIAQVQFGLIPLEGGIVDYYPIKMQFGDFLAVFGIVIFTGLITSTAPIYYFTRKAKPKR